MSCMRAGDTREVVMPIQWLTVHQQLREFLLWLICKLQRDWCLCSWDLSNLSHQTLRWRMLANRYGASKNSSSQTFLNLGIVITRACSIHNSQCDFKTALKLNRYNNCNCLTLSSPFIYPKRLSPGEKKGTSKNYRWTLPNLFTSPFIYPKRLQPVCCRGSAWARRPWSAATSATSLGRPYRRRRRPPPDLDRRRPWKLLERGFGVIGEGIWVWERERDARERERKALIGVILGSGINWEKRRG